ncbi:Nif11-like leader peptide family natural product precursor [Leptolyngbya sp. AN03gr2]|uniref:Nif11-like leader peptide family natural product precursor n=1 Tax=unclassified Leptolyngbya TaxID=2650499 RepID=UPI003D3106B0
MKTMTTKTTTDLQQFYTQVLKDPMLQEQLKAATTPENLCELAVELGKEQGYFFTKEEALAAFQIELAFAGESIEVGDSLDRSHSDIAFRPVMTK